jgi:hypothetical protein
MPARGLSWGSLSERAVDAANLPRDSEESAHASERRRQPSLARSESGGTCVRCGFPYNGYGGHGPGLCEDKRGRRNSAEPGA